MRNSTIIPKKRHLVCGCFDFAFSKKRCKFHATLEDTKKRNALNREKPLIRKIADTQDKELAKDADEKVKKEKWFREIRKKLTGTCQCGCGNKSQKKDDMYFRHSCCHVFPKSKFSSIKYHPDNYVERAFFGGCHGVMDDTSIDRWVGMADWDDIKMKFHILSPFLTAEEKATKFYSHLERLVNEN